jgi:hypothetical protein
MWNTYAVAAQVNTCAAFAAAAQVEYLCRHLIMWNTYAVAAQVNTCAAFMQQLLKWNTCAGI